MEIQIAKSFWWGGQFETLIGSWKKSLSVVLGKTSLNCSEHEKGLLTVKIILQTIISNRCYKTIFYMEKNATILSEILDEGQSTHKKPLMSGQEILRKRLLCWFSSFLP